MRLNANNEQFTDEFLKAHLAFGFGNVSKREVDLLILRLVVEYDHSLSWDKPPTAFMQAQQLSVEQGKLRSMMDKLSYRRPADHKDKLARATLQNLLKTQDVQSAKGSIKIQVEDVYVREYAKSLVKEAGGIVDGSFDRNIICSSADRYLELAAELAEESETKQREDALQNKISTTRDLSLTTEERRQDIRHEFLKAVAGLAGEELTSIMFRLGKMLLTSGASQIS